VDERITLAQQHTKQGVIQDGQIRCALQMRHHVHPFQGHREQAVCIGMPAFVEAQICLGSQENRHAAATTDILVENIDGVIVEPVQVHQVDRPKRAQGFQGDVAQEGRTFHGWPDSRFGARSWLENRAEKIGIALLSVSIHHQHRHVRGQIHHQPAAVVNQYRVIGQFGLYRVLARRRKADLDAPREDFARSNAVDQHGGQLVDSPLQAAGQVRRRRGWIVRRADHQLHLLGGLRAEVPDPCLDE
jgi:hypothetical protein